MPRPRKPTELLKAKGTYEKNKPSQQGRIDDTLEMIDANASISPPSFLAESKELTSYWHVLVTRLISWKQLSEIDLPKLKDAFFDLLQETKIQEQLLVMAMDNPLYDNLHKRYLRHVNACDKVLYRFGLTPVERAKLRVSITQADNNTAKTVLDKVKAYSSK